MLPLRLSSLRVANKKSAATKILFARAILALVLCMGLGGRLTGSPFYAPALLGRVNTSNSILYF